MKVLITGGYGFIGSFVAEKFHKEGYQIYIIDNLSSGQRENISIPHKFYQLNVEDRKCDEVFQSVSPDIVIHLAAQVDVESSVQRPHVDTQSNILGLVNILRCANKAKVSKLILASSAAVYGSNNEASLPESSTCNPVSPYGINKLLGEHYCSKWMELYGLQTLCLRLSNVYGPRQGSLGEGGVVSILLEQLREGKEIKVYGDGAQTNDFIYVEDVVDGIYRGAKSHVTGVYNLSTNTQTSVNQLIEMMSELQQVGKAHSAAPAGDINYSSLDNTRVKRDLDWVPLYDMKQGIEKTLEWFNRQVDSDISKKSKSKRKKTNSTWWISVKPYAENLFVFIILASISLFASDWLLYTSLDFKLIYVILLGILYGTRQSALSAVLASSLYFYENMNNGRDPLSLLYDPEALFVIAMYLFFGLIVGFVADKSKRNSVRIHNELQLLKDKYIFLKEVYKDTRKVKEELQRQLINSKDSIGRIHNIIKSLESLEPDEIVTSSVKVLSDLLETDRISVFSVNNSDYLRLMIKSNAAGFDLPKTIKVSEYPYYKEVIRSGLVFVNKGMEADIPMLVSPIFHEGQVVALVSVYEPSFDKLNLNYENLFKVSVNLISSSLSRAFQYVGGTRNERFIEETTILKQPLFLQVLQTKIRAKQQYNTDYVLLSIEDNGESMITKSKRISAALRESDYMGMVNNVLILLLSNSNTSEADFVIQRLNNNGVFTKVMSGEELNG